MQTKYYFIEMKAVMKSLIYRSKPKKPLTVRSCHVTCESTICKNQSIDLQYKSIN